MTQQLSIGEFARATGLSAKALRLYDELGLVPPARVDAHNGYRWYDGEQVAAARLVARLRSAGVPLALIAVVVRGEPDLARAELLSWWRGVEADLAAARAVVTSLVADLEGQDTPMTTDTEHPDTPRDTPRDIPRSAHRGGQGARSAQLDAVTPTVHRPVSRFGHQVTGQGLFAVADGFGAEGGAAIAALEVLEGLDEVEPGPDPLGDLDAAVATAAAAVDEQAPAGSGTTLTALLLVPGRALLAHVGDTRAYLVRAGRLEQLTRDHGVAQSLVDEGRLTEEEARTDPRRPQVYRALGDGAPSAPDLLVRASEPGDRIVLMSDGVHAVVDRASLGELLVAPGDPDDVAAGLERAVLAAGAPDNYGLVVVDV